MRNKVTTTFLALLILFSFMGTGLAMEKGNKIKGKYTYKKVYKMCHQRGEWDSTTPKLSPVDKEQTEWEAIFDNQTFDEFECQEEWAKLTEADLANIFTYLYSHASDSGNPVTCK